MSALEEKYSLKVLKKTQSCNLFLTLIIVALLAVQYYQVQSLATKIEQLPKNIYDKVLQTRMLSLLDNIAIPKEGRMGHNPTSYTQFWDIIGKDDVHNPPVQDNK